jgi:hypothetical protein
MSDYNIFVFFPQCTIRIRSPRCDGAVSRQTRRTAARATTPPPLPPRRPGLAAAIPAAAVPRKAPPPTTKIGMEYRPTYPAALGISNVDPEFRIRLEDGPFGGIWRLFISVVDPDPDPGPQNPHVFGPPGTGSGSISQRYRSPDPDLNQNVTDPQHCISWYFFCSARFRRTILETKTA